MSPASPKRPSKREVGAEDRRQAILDAALAEFSEKGFEGARLDDIAKRAGVAKGTIYLLARDKTDLFEKVVLQALGPMLTKLSVEGAEAPASLEQFRSLFRFFLDEVLATDRKLVAQIVLREAGRFPEIARFYHREVIARILGFVTDAAQRAERDGLLEFKSLCAISAARGRAHGARDDLGRPIRKDRPSRRRGPARRPFRGAVRRALRDVLNMTADQKPSRAGRAAIVVALIALAAAALAVYSLGLKSPADAYARLQSYWKGSDGALTLQGNVEVRQVNLGFKVAGRIEKLMVDEGDRVKAGQPLASLETVYFEDAVAQARASHDFAVAAYAKMKAGNRKEDIDQAEATLTQQQATLLNSTQTLDRAQALLASATGTVKEYDDAMGAQREAAARVNVAKAALAEMKAGFRAEDIDAAAAQAAALEATLKTAEQQLADTVLMAPSDGVIESRAEEVGAIVSIGAPVFVMSIVNPVWVRTYLSEPELARVKPGMKVEVKRR